MTEGASDIPAGAVSASGPGLSIEAGNRPGVLGQAVELHARYYAAAAGFVRNKHPAAMTSFSPQRTILYVHG